MEKSKVVEKFFSSVKLRADTDFVDRLNYYYTPMLLAFFSLTLSAKQYVGQSIQCWVPAQFTGAWEQYSEYYCFVKNTYFVPFHEELPETADRKNLEIGYYQWVPFVLALQAFLFFIPVMVWRLFNWNTGIKVKGLINAAVDVTNMEEEKRDKNAMIVARHITDGLEMQSSMKGNLVTKYLLYGKRNGLYITSLYLFVKVLWMINVIGQFFILNSFLGPQYTFWGFDILRDLLSNRPWEESGHFPRVTMCDFKVRVLGNLQNHSIQCVLMINMFSEKIYLFLWWWFVVVALLNVINLIFWSIVSFAANVRRDYVDYYLRVYTGLSEDNEEGPVTKRALSELVDRDLRPDGVLLLRLIASNAGDVVATSLVGALWKLFCEKHKKNVPPPPSITGEKTPEKDKNVVEPGFVESLPEEKVPLTGYQPLAAH